MGRAPCCDKANVKRGPWSPEEDETLKSYIEQHGTGGNWISLPLKAGLRRCGKSCRLRWLNYLRPDIKHGKFTEEEDRVILSLYDEIGSRWSIIAAKLNGRTDNDVKNHWNTKLKKLLMIKNNQNNNTNYTVDHSFSAGTTSDYESSYSVVKFPNMKTKTHKESLPTKPNLVPDVSRCGSSLSFYHHEPVGFMAPKSSISPNSAGSELSNSSSTINVGNVLSWSDGGGMEDSGFLIDMLNYGEGMDNGCQQLFQSAAEMPNFSAMLSDDMYELKPQEVYQY
ncbi:hypothetical protein QQ045_015899 [Rhodiola kirilowii]